MTIRFLLSLPLIFSLLTFLLIQPRLNTVSAEIPATFEETCPALPGSLEPFITWFPAKKTCPVCATENIFMVPGSWGSYIYQYPSKYQLIFWPYTDSASWHSCKQCRLTTFMADFENMPKDKIAALRKVLESTKLPPQKNRPEKESFERPPYLELPMSDRLVVAERVYRALDVKEDHFWAQFYRVMAFHQDEEKKTAQAAESRRMALKIVEAWLSDKTKDASRKESLYICGAMRHFLEQDAEALKLFEEADKLKYSNPANKPEENEGYDKYLSNLIKDYIEQLKKGEGPRKLKQDH